MLLGRLEQLGVSGKAARGVKMRKTGMSCDGSQGIGNAEERLTSDGACGGLDGALKIS